MWATRQYGGELPISPQIPILIQVSVNRTLGFRRMVKRIEICHEVSRFVLKPTRLHVSRITSPSRCPHRNTL